jgi:hypothetical protein
VVIACNPQPLPQIPIPGGHCQPRVPGADDGGHIHVIPDRNATPIWRAIRRPTGGHFDFRLRRITGSRTATNIDATLDPSIIRTEGRAQ